MMTKAEITRALRLITSPAFKRDRGRLPIAVLANLAGLSRLTLYRARDGYVTDGVAELLSPLLEAILANDTRATRRQQRWMIEVSQDR